jgi:ABC-2 type transport system ATP-binding protein
MPLRVESLAKNFPSGPDWRQIIPVLRNRPRKIKVRPIDDVSFEIQRGEIYGIIGANGSGKSTLVRVLSTLLLPDSGLAEVFGYDVVREPAKVRPAINRVSADPSFFRSMSAIENLMFFGRVYGLKTSGIKSRAYDILERLMLTEEQARDPMQNLSRGQQQKVAVARAFLTSPVLMLLDEPTTGLDPRSRREVQAFIQTVRRDHDATILLTTHDMQEADLLCDRIAVFSSGRIIAEGTPDQLRALVAGDRPLDEVDMEEVYLELTGRSIEEDQETHD